MYRASASSGRMVKPVPQCVAVAPGIWRVLEWHEVLRTRCPGEWKGVLMTSAEQATLDQALALARKLPPSTRAELVALIVRELVGTPSSPPQRLTPEQARAAVADIRAAVQALPQPRPTLGEQLEADRRSRDQALGGDSAGGASDVHP
jgi:hypothetical protein